MFAIYNIARYNKKADGVKNLSPNLINKIIKNVALSYD